MTGPRVSLVDKIVAVHRSLDAASLPHAFGGALALAWCTQQARGTIDIDVNVFMTVDAIDRVLEALAPHVICLPEDLTALRRDGQARLWWADTPVDLFLSTTEFHDRVAERIRVEPFAGDSLPFLSCTDLAVFKAFFNRPRDWVDLAEMADAGTFDVDRASGTLARYLGPDDARVQRMLSLLASGK